jgi:hypothetical protein
LNVPNSEYIIDSYRDRLEITKIEIIWDTLEHKDYLLNVEEDKCGTNASLKVKISYGMLKSLEHNSFELEHNDIWDRVDFFLGKKEEVFVDNMKLTRNDNLMDAYLNNMQNLVNKKTIVPTKNFNECIINDEFDLGVIKDKINDETK